jgi:thioredoxin-related protein
LKRVIIIVLSILILSPSFGSLLVYASFKINQKEISKTICVKRKLVFNSCNGRCELQKSIKKYSDNERKMQDSLKDKLELVYVQSPSEVSFAIAAAALESKENTSILSDKKPVRASNLTFHPPLWLV